MFNFIRNHQLDIMLALCSICCMMAVLLLITRFLPKKRKWILISMELLAVFLLGFDRMAYIYSGNTTSLGYFMVRFSNFIVFFLTSAVVFTFNLYISDLLSSSGLKTLPRRLILVSILSLLEMLMVILNLFTGFYYFFDSNNVYHRGSGFLICYIVPVVCPFIQFSAIQKYRKSFSPYIYCALIMYIFFPIIIGIIQIFAYGISIVNMAMVMVSVSLYIFTYLDINNEVVKTHKLEMQDLKRQQAGMKILFSQTAEAFVSAIEMRHEDFNGQAKKNAEVAKSIALKAEKSEDFCDEVYYAALLHNAGYAVLPDSIFAKKIYTPEEEAFIKAIPGYSEEILSKITEYPYLSECCKYVTERYDGKGNKQALKGDEIPEIARIVAIADEYCNLTLKTKNHAPVPNAVLRENFIKEAGERFDPYYSNLIVQLIDTEALGNTVEENDEIESSLSCRQYRENISVGIPVVEKIVSITFNGEKNTDGEEVASEVSTEVFSAPSLVLFDSFDRRVHEDEKNIEAFRYIEFGELWFDGHYISTSARNMEVEAYDSGDEAENVLGAKELYTISAGRFEDHLMLELKYKSKTVKAIVALPDNSRSVYIGLTGENFSLQNIKVEDTGKQVTKNSIPRIASQISFIQRLEADIPNIQINGTRSASTNGILIKERMSIAFHMQSFPEASFIWHCPYIVIFYSDDGKVGGKNYHEYAMVKLNGEENGSNSFAENQFLLKKNEHFTSWADWNIANKAGRECEIDFLHQGSSVTFDTENLGIFIENTTIIRNGPKEVYVALTGDQCALTDIRVR